MRVRPRTKLSPQKPKKRKPKTRSPRWSASIARNAATLRPIAGQRVVGRKVRGQRDTRGNATGQRSAATVEQTPDEAWATIEIAEEQEWAKLSPHVAALVASQKSGMIWDVYDSGASQHISPIQERFVTYESIAPRPIMSSNSQVFHAIGQGDIYVDVPNGATYSKVLLRNALHMPDMAFTVVSLGRVMKAGYLVEFDCHGNHSHCYDHGSEDFSFFYYYYDSLTYRGLPHLPSLDNAIQTPSRVCQLRFCCARFRTIISYG